MEEEFDLFDSIEGLYEIPIDRRAKTSNTDINISTDFGESRYDDMFFPDAELNKDGSGYDLFDIISEHRSDRQPWVAKFLAGVGRVGTKALTEISKMPGVAGGIIAGAAGQLSDVITGKDNTDFMKIAFNNPWIKTINDFNEQINEDILPVYVSKAVKEGDIWDNVSSIDFWATEGADGLGYIISMLAPGAVINKFSLGAKSLSAVNKFARMSSKTDEAFNILSKAGITPKNADLHASTIANTLFEAGAEAGYAMDSYEEELKQQLESGQISEEEYNRKIAKSSEIGRKIFLTNVAILVGPNAVMSKMIWGKPRNRKISSFNKKKKIEGIPDPSLLKSLKLGGDDFGKAALREGAFEEGLQSVTEEFYTDDPDASLYDFLTELPKSYLDMVTSTDGQKAILLGSLFGGGMQAYTGSKARSNERNTVNNLISQANSSLSDFYTIFNEDTYSKDNEGNIQFDSQGEPILDNLKVLEKMKSLQNMEVLSQVFDQAIENNDTETIDQIKDLVTTHLVKPFIINDNLGIEVLRENLEATRESIPLENKKDTFIEDIISKATTLKNSYNTFTNFADRLINLEGGTESDKVSFFNRKASEYVDLKARELYLKNKLSNEQSLKQNILEETEEDSGDRRLEVTNSNIKVLEKSIKQNKKELNKYWDGKSLNKEYKKVLKAKEELENLRENVKELDDLINKVNNAATLDDLYNIDTNNELIKDALNNAKAKREKEIIDEKSKRDNEKKEDNVEKSVEESIKKSDEVENIISNYNVGEDIFLPDGFEEFSNKDVTITNIDDVSIEVEDNEGNKKVISLDDFNNNFNVNNNYSTEGTDAVENKVSPINNENIKNDTPVISIDKDGRKVSFVDQSVIDFQNQPVNKIGNKVGFTVNQSKDLSSQQIAARNLYNEGNFENTEFLVKYLPLSVKLTDTVTAPIYTDTGSNTEAFNRTTRKLRESVIEALKQGNSIESIQTEIVGQNNGELQIAPKENGEVAENSLLGLYEINNDISKIKSEDIYVVDDLGTLKNINDDILPAGRELAKGEIYLKIHTANGTPFPLKLNVRKINRTEAEILYELYSYRFEDIKEGKSIRLSDTTEQLYNNVQRLLPNIVKWFNNNGKATEDITVKDLVDFLIYDNSKSIKSQVRFIKGNKLYVGKKAYTKDQFLESKDEFIEFLTSEKRHHIRFKNKEGEKAPSLQNRSYLEYLVNNNILNTNAVVNEPTFQGNTSIYLSQDKVTVNGKKLNESIFKEKEEKVSPTSKNVEKEEFGVESGLDLTKFGLKAAPVKKKQSNSPYLYMDQKDLNILQDQMQNLDYIRTEPFEYKGKKYLITKDTFYTINITTNEIVEDVSLIKNILEDYNSKAAKISENFVFDIKPIIEVWKNRINSVPETINFKSLSSEKLFNIKKQMILSFKPYIKDIQIINNKNISEADKVKQIYEMLQNKNISREELKVKCGL